MCCPEEEGSCPSFYACHQKCYTEWFILKTAKISRRFLFCIRMKSESTEYTKQKQNKRSKMALIKNVSNPSSWSLFYQHWPENGVAIKCILFSNTLISIFFFLITPRSMKSSCQKLLTALLIKKLTKEDPQLDIVHRFQVYLQAVKTTCQYCTPNNLQVSGSSQTFMTLDSEAKYIMQHHREDDYIKFASSTHQEAPHRLMK